MVFRRESDHCYRVSDWDRFPWLEHGFGTKHSVWPEPLQGATLKQIHSAESLIADQPGCLGPGDALLSRKSGLYLSIRTADCVPILFVDPAKRAIAAIHAGWRGTVAQIGPKVICRMLEEFGTRAVDVEVAIGPAIGVCCYEVGPEVASQLAATFPDRKDLHTRTHIDLAEANRCQLIQSGVRPDAIAIARMCTFCGKDDFHSFRRDAESAGRLISAIRII